MIGVMLSILIVPLAAGIICAILPARRTRMAAAVTVAAGVASFVLVLTLVPAAAHHDLNYLSYLRADAVSAIFLLATGFLYAAVAVYAVGYAQRHEDLYGRRFYAGLNLFAWAMLAAPLMSSLALLWIAVEITTIVSALLVAIEDTNGAAEAAWKYVLIASAGLGLALLGTVFAYYAGSQVLGEHYNLAIDPLIAAGPHLPAISTVHCVSCMPWNVDSPTCSVMWLSVLMATSGHRKSFQDHMNWMIPSVANAGSDSGRMILNRIPSR